MLAVVINIVTGIVIAIIISMELGVSLPDLTL